MILIQPWEKSLIKSDRESDPDFRSGHQPDQRRNSDPPGIPGAHRGYARKELAKDVKKKGDGAKVAIRNIRRDANEAFKKMEKEREISEDDLKDLTEKIQKLTDKTIDKSIRP